MLIGHMLHGQKYVDTPSSFQQVSLSRLSTLSAFLVKLSAKTVHHTSSQTEHSKIICPQLHHSLQSCCLCCTGRTDSITVPMVLDGQPLIIRMMLGCPHTFDHLMFYLSQMNLHEEKYVSVLRNGGDVSP